MMMEVVFDIEKETKNTIRYKASEEDGPAAVDTIYIKKWALKQLSLNGKIPERVKITIETY